MSKQEIMLTAWLLTQLFWLQRNTSDVSCYSTKRRTSSWTQHNRTKKCTGTSLFLLHVLGKSRSRDTFSVSTRCLDATRLPGYLWSAKQFFGIPEADTEYWRSVTLFEDSNVPKAVEVASVIAAETLPPTFHAEELYSFRAYLQVQRPGSKWIRFSSD